jgi:hypothetical protein
LFEKAGLVCEWHHLGWSLKPAMVATPVLFAGIAAVLQNCQLTALELHGCTGTFTDALARHLPTDRRLACRLQDLRISWGAPRLTAAGLAALLHPNRAALRCLSLKGCSGLDDSAWQVIGQHADTLECLELDSCGALARAQKTAGPAVVAAAKTPGSSAGSGALTTAAALEALAPCRRLLALTLRNSTVPAWTPADYDLLRKLPYLQSVSVS